MRLLNSVILEQGYVELGVEFITGDSATVRLTAPNWRKRRELILAFQQSLDTFLFVHECLIRTMNVTDQVERFLDQLTPNSLGRVEQFALALCIGETDQKKMEEAGRELVLKMREAKQVTVSSNGSGPNVASREAREQPAEKSEAGPGPA